MKTLSIGSRMMVGPTTIRQEIVLKALLICGVLSTPFHAAMDIIDGTRWDHYSWISQEFSQLSAVGTPSRPLHLVLACVYAALVVAFGLSVFWAAGKRLALRAVGILLVVFALNSWIWPQFFPLNFSGPVSSFTNTMHIILAVVVVLCVFAQIVLAANAFGKKFRLYSIVTLLIVFGFGFATFPQVAARTAGLDTPWVGLTERFNIYGHMIWMMALAIGLLQSMPNSLSPDG